MKKLLVGIFVIIGAVLLIAACSKTNQGATRQSVQEWDTSKPRKLDLPVKMVNGKRDLLFIYIMDMYSEGHVQEVMDVRERIELFNNELRPDLNISLVLMDSQVSIEKQLADAEAAVAMNPDVVMINAVDTVGSIPAVETIWNAGIYVIDNRGVQTEKRDVFHIGTAESLVGEYIGDHVKNYLDSNPTARVNVGLIDGGPTYPEQSKRLDGIKALARTPPYDQRITILAEQFGNWRTDTAMNVMEDWIQAYPTMNYLVTCSDEMAIGCVAALRGANLLQNFRILSVNGALSGLTMLRDGIIEITVGFNQKIAKATQIDAAIALIDHTLEDKYYDVSREGTIPVTLANMEQFMRDTGFEFDGSSY